MLVGEIIDELTLMLGNVLASTGHPFRSPSDIRFRWVTRAANKIPRLAAAGGRDIGSTFQELTATWKGQTQEGFAYVSRPANALVIREMYSFKKTGADADRDSVTLIQQVGWDVYEMTKRDSSVKGWPTIWTPKGQRLYVAPIPVSPYLTDVHLHGLKRETGFTDRAQTPILNEDWHEAILFEAAAIGARELGYFDRAKEYRAHVAELVTTGIEVPVQEDLYDSPTFDFEGMTQMDVYE